MSRESEGIARVTRSREAARALYDRLSRWYDVLSGGAEQRLGLACAARLRVRDGETVLEIGCGTGRALAALARAAGRAGTVLGVDLSAGMLEVAADRLARAGLAGHAAPAGGDAVALPLKDGCVDVVFMGFTLELFDTPEIPQVLRECLRVVRPGGRAGVVSLSKAGPPNRLRDAYEWVHARFPELVDCRPIFAARALAEAGWHVAEIVKASLWGLPVEMVVATRIDGTV